MATIKSYITEQQQSTSKRSKSIPVFYIYRRIPIYLFDKSPAPTAVKALQSLALSIQKRIPVALFKEVDTINVGTFPDLKQREVNSVYKDGVIFLDSTNLNSPQDAIRDVVHELAHSWEETHRPQLYGDGKVEKEFMSKRIQMLDYIQAHIDGLEIPVEAFSTSDYNQEADNFLFKTVGYDRLANMIGTLFVGPYATTSLGEYFASTFEAYFFGDAGANELSTTSPAVLSAVERIMGGK